MKEPVALLLARWPVVAALASAAMLAIAHGFQSIGGLEPCLLCLRQREVYWAALAVGVAAVAVDRVYHRVWLCRLFSAALAVIFLVGAGVAAYHAGAEWKWWPGPDACAAASGGATADAMAAALGGAKVEAPRCDEAAWVFLGLSMAGWNAVASLVLAGLSAWAALQPRYLRQLPPQRLPETA
ncbi:MAG TPA: disulfide bond formation protein B [Caulobacteraceae bacterium]|jgi:disulfide bond formation protein DsbB